jgi:hypothetical protein
LRASRSATRHVKNLVLHVENKGLYVEAIQRSNEKFSALQLERMPVSRPLAIQTALEERSRLLLKLGDWGRHFIKRTAGQKMAERLREQFARWEAMRSRLAQTVSEKIEVKEAVTQKITPAAKETPVERVTPAEPSVTEKLREGLSKPVEEMAEKLRQKRRETIRVEPAPPVERPKQRPRYTPTVSRPQERRGYRM